MGASRTSGVRLRQPRLLCIALLPLVLFCQQTKKTPAKEKPPDSGFLISPLVFKDDGCAKDYLKAQALSGVEKRKALAEIAEYGCLEERLNAIYHAAVASTTSVVLSKTQTVKISRVSVIVDWDRTGRLLGKEPDYEHTSLGAVGWIIDSDLLRLTEAQVDALIAKQKAEGR
jgi:hypothetical protein